ncbi:protoporphyrinogen oxidase HemJ [Oculatella sp. LEGE 06141]|uniref:protoporphyrinogen oxidase HemJ n=1 Tax=Oculatella sp. LEGE 06141 TaxID=1828648 RepID=UPI001880ACD8|nr:protoporphyrinogen oxidase HemJ [Oculatella sp. LEGE 06141]MBE9178078.1 protoporphyrinogen oxidase HemJ [Oculatella sp. LEGE 06141]
MNYLWFKAFHIIGIVAWFAGLFYLPRLFVYHVEANEQPEPARSILQQQYQIMEKRLYRIIMTPALVVTVTMAIAMLVINPDLLHDRWLHIKLGLVGLLLVYDHYCLRLMKQMSAGKFTLTGQQLRWFNEVSTILLVLIVMLAVFKNNFPTSGAAWTVFAMVVAMAAAIQLYAKKRRLDQERKMAEAASLNGAASEPQAG